MSAYNSSEDTPDSGRYIMTTMEKQSKSTLFVCYHKMNNKVRCPGDTEPDDFLSTEGTCYCKKKDMCAVSLVEKTKVISDQNFVLNVSVIFMQIIVKVINVICSKCKSSYFMLF